VAKYSIKSEMISCVKLHGVFCDPATRKGPMYYLILKGKPKENISKICSY
jgi:hypothetical protein